MADKDEFRAQNSINLSLALIAAAFALVAGILAALFAVTDKIPSEYRRLIFGVISFAILCCSVSVYYGGRGISATTRSLRAGEAKYDGGNFNRQAIAGVTALVLTIVFIVLAMNVRGENPAGGQPVSTEVARLKVQLETLATDVRSVQKDISQLKEENNRLKAELQKPSAKQNKSKPTNKQP